MNQVEEKFRALANGFEVARGEIATRSNPEDGLSLVFYPVKPTGQDAFAGVNEVEEIHGELRYSVSYRDCTGSNHAHFGVIEAAAAPTVPAE